MSTKNIARTAIEGGRRNKFERRQSTATERAATSAYEHKVANDVEAWDEVAEPRRQPVRPEFADKLQPVQRFLMTRIGHPWDKVRSELLRRFNRKTTAGRHLLFDHILNNVATSPKDYAKWFLGFVVDSHGLLQENLGKYRIPTPRNWP